MRQATQGFLLVLLSAVLLRIALTDAYLRYVTEWMRWPLVVSAAVLLLMALGPALFPGDDQEPPAHDGEHAHGDDHRVPLVTWLLVLPGLVTFVVYPPELGSYLAERRAGETVAAARPDEVTDLDPSTTVELPIDEFTWRAQTDDSLTGQPVSLTGFVSWGEEPGTWFVSRLAIGCCAADATAYRVEVRGAARPERDAWVAVEGVHVPGTGSDFVTPPAVDAVSVVPVPEPTQTYG